MGINPSLIPEFVLDCFRDTRFQLTSVVSINRSASYNPRFKIYGVRLRDRKQYCGNHPGGCELVGRKEVSRKFLEGADWVEFNDRLNDRLDEEQVSAVIWSEPDRVRSQVGERMRIRIGMHRRCIYEMVPSDYPNQNATWELNGDRSHFKVGTVTDRGLTSFFPEGTPGTYKYMGKDYHCIG